jgi:hypothetical protein
VRAAPAGGPFLSCHGRFPPPKTEGKKRQPAFPRKRKSL